MTVCVAAIVAGNRVLGVADRMLSSSDIAFEPATPKIHWLTSAIFVMTSGDAAVQSEIIGRLQFFVDRHISDPGAGWLAVSDVAQSYLHEWNELKRRRAEATILAPLGLNSASFLGTHSLDASVVDRIANALIGFNIPRVEVIVAGIDETGPHIWVVEDGVARCEDRVGFACIGSGRRHAESQLMIGQHQPHSDFLEGLVLAHLSKKRAEVSPSVGTGTDMVISGPELGQQVTLADMHISKLDQNYRQLVAGERKALARGHKAFATYLTGLFSSSAVPQNEPSVAA